MIVQQQHFGILRAQDPEMDALREKLYKVCIWQCIIGGLLPIFAWASYGWGFVLGGLALAIGITGVYHLKTLDALRYETCCCNPLSAVRQMYTTNLFVIISAVLTLVLAGVFLAQGGGVRLVFALGVIVLGLASLVVAVYSYGDFKRLKELAELEEPMPIPVLHHTAPVIQVQPMYVQPGYAQPMYVQQPPQEGMYAQPAYGYVQPGYPVQQQQQPGVY